MKFNILILVGAFCGLVFVSCSSNTKNSEVDSVSYAYGITIGENLRRFKLEHLDPKIIASGISDVLKNDGENAKMTNEESMEVLNNYFTKLQTEIFEKNLKEGEEFLEKNKSAEGVVTLPSGLQYKIVSEGEGVKPSANDEVELFYRGTFLNGEEFDSSYEDKPVKLKLNQNYVIQGWIEGLQQVKEGSKVILYIPAEMAYGDQRFGSIEPNSTLIYEVKLLKVTKEKPTKRST
jgi:FKBP-type peptidyl-prolyl cis-trans isomerase